MSGWVGATRFEIPQGAMHQATIFIKKNTYENGNMKYSK